MGEVVVVARPHEGVLVFVVLRVVLLVAVDAAVVSLLGSVLVEDLAAIVEVDSVHKGLLYNSI